MSYVPYTRLALAGNHDDNHPGFFTPYSSFFEQKRPRSVPLRVYRQDMSDNMSDNMSFQRAVEKTIGTLALVQDGLGYMFYSAQTFLSAASHALFIAEALTHLNANDAWDYTQKTFEDTAEALAGAAFALGTSFRFVFNLVKETLALVTRLLATAVAGLLSLCPSQPNAEEEEEEVMQFNLSA